MAGRWIQDQEFIAIGAAEVVEVHFAGVFEEPDGLEDADFGGVDVAPGDGAEEGDFLVDGGGGAFGDGGKENVLEMGAGGFEGQGEVAQINFAHDFLQGGRAEEDQVLEGEHFLADVAAQFRVVFFQVAQDGLAEIFFQGVEQVGGRADAAGLAEGGGGPGAGFAAEDLDDAFEDFERGWPHHGEAFDDLVARDRGQESEEGRTFFRGQIADEEGDGLGLLVLEEIEKLAGVHFQERLHGGHGRGGGGDAAEDVGGAEGADGFFQGCCWRSRGRPERRRWRRRRRR